MGVLSGPCLAQSGTASLPVDVGELVTTGCPGIGALDGYVVTLIDVHQASMAPLAGMTGTNRWRPPWFHNEAAANPNDVWSAQNLGQVFGVTLDAADPPNIYVTASTVYGDFETQGYSTFGPGGGGAIYRLDGLTGAICTLAQLPNPNPSVARVGLGNIAFSPVGNWLYVSNFDDGLIYRVPASICGQAGPFATFDHGVDGRQAQGLSAIADTPVTGFTPLGRRVWGLAVNEFERRLYYAVWWEDGETWSSPPHVRPSSTESNEIWSVALDTSGGFVTGTAKREFLLPAQGSIGGVALSNPVSSIGFSPYVGLMILAERTRVADTGQFLVGGNNDAHASRVLEYVGHHAAWTPTPVNKYKVGYLTTNSSFVANSAGGAQYDCDANVWATGDALYYNGVNLLIYGLQRIPFGGNGTVGPPSTLSSILIDLDDVVTRGAKTRVGCLALRRGPCPTPSPANPHRDDLTVAPLPNNFIPNFTLVSMFHDPRTDPVGVDHAEWFVMRSERNPSFNGLVSILVAQPGGAFGQAVDYSVGRGASSAVLRDFNGDARADLAVTNFYDNSVSILYRNSDGTYQPSINYPVGTNPDAIAAGDFNGDGCPDLAVANYYGHTVTILRGNPNGTFHTPGVEYACGYNPLSLAVGEFDRDGNLDLAVATFPNTISIMHGDGHAAFQHTADIVVGDVPSSVVVGDFDRDGSLDLAATNYSSNTVSILRGNGNGTFQAPVNYNVGGLPQALAVGDLNGDGFSDLAVANLGASTVTVLLGNGNGTFQVSNSYDTSLNPISIAIADLNGDGRPDIATASSASPIVTRLAFIPTDPCATQPPIIDQAGGTVVIPGVAFAPTFIGPHQVLWYSFSICSNVTGSGLHYVDIDMDGSDPTADTQMAMYNSTGHLVAMSDDEGLGSLSQLSFGDVSEPRGSVGGDLLAGQNGDLPAGDYYLAITLASAVFPPNGYCVASNYSGAPRSIAVKIETNFYCSNICYGTCVADFDDGTGTGTPDEGVTIDDLLYYLFIFEVGYICADVDDGTSTGTPDGGVTIDDLLYYLFRFESGC